MRSGGDAFVGTIYNPHASEEGQESPRITEVAPDGKSTIVAQISPPQLPGPGNNDEPNITVAPNGSALAAWYTYRARGPEKIVVDYRPADEAWQPPQVLTSATFEGLEVLPVIASDGQAAVMWSTNYRPPMLAIRSSSGTWSQCQMPGVEFGAAYFIDQGRELLSLTPERQGVGGGQIAATVDLSCNVMSRSRPTGTIGRVVPEPAGGALLVAAKHGRVYASELSTAGVISDTRLVGSVPPGAGAWPVRGAVDSAGREYLAWVNRTRSLKHPAELFTATRSGSGDWRVRSRPLGPYPVPRRYSTGQRVRPGPQEFRPWWVSAVTPNSNSALVILSSYPAPAGLGSSAIDSVRINPDAATGPPQVVASDPSAVLTAEPIGAETTGTAASNGRATVVLWSRQKLYKRRGPSGILQEFVSRYG